MRAISQQQYEALVSLAGVVADTDEFSGLGNNAFLISDDPELKELMIQQLSDQKKSTLQNAVGAIVALDGMKEDAIQSLVEDLREIRRREMYLKAAIKKIERAAAYGRTSRNYLPVVKEVVNSQHTNCRVCLSRQEEIAAMHEVPADWSVDAPNAEKETAPKVKRTAK